MRKLYLKWGHVLAALVLMVASHTINITCSANFFQEEIPDQIKKMRKF